jgi:hypothetical protein
MSEGVREAQLMSAIEEEAKREGESREYRQGA